MFLPHCNLGTLLSYRGDEQVIAPFLITLRIANRSALASGSVVSGSVGSVRFGSQGRSTGDSGTLSDKNPVGLVEANGKSSDGVGGGVKTTVDQVTS